MSLISTPEILGLGLAGPSNWVWGGTGAHASGEAVADFSGDASSVLNPASPRPRLPSDMVESEGMYSFLIEVPGVHKQDVEGKYTYIFFSSLGINTSKHHRTSNIYLLLLFTVPIPFTISHLTLPLLSSPPTSHHRAGQDRRHCCQQARGTSKRLRFLHAPRACRGPRETMVFIAF